MKKIAFVMPEYSLPTPNIGGGAVEELLTILINKNEQAKDGFKFCIVQPQFSESEMQKLDAIKLNNTELFYCKKSGKTKKLVQAINKGFRFLKIKKQISSKYEKNVFKILKQIKPDAVIFDGATFRNTDPLAKFIDRKNVYLQQHSQYLNKENIFKNIGNVIGVSEFISKDFKKWFDAQGITDVNCITHLNCVNEEKFNKQISAQERVQLRNKLGFNENDFVVLYCGRLVWQKGIKELISAVLKCKENIKMLIVGSLNFSRKDKSKYSQEIEQLVKQNADKIKFTGYVPNNEIFKYYQCADMQAVPSVYEEAFGLVVVEGMYCGLPQVVTKSGGIVEAASPEGAIILDKENDLIENLKCAIEKLSTDDELRRKMSQVNKQAAKKFTAENYYKNFVEIMEKKTNE